MANSWILEGRKPSNVRLPPPLTHHTTFPIFVPWIESSLSCSTGSVDFLLCFVSYNTATVLICPETPWLEFYHKWEAVYYYFVQICSLKSDHPSLSICIGTPPHRSQSGVQSWFLQLWVRKHGHNTKPSLRWGSQLGHQKIVGFTYNPYLQLLLLPGPLGK